MRTVLASFGLMGLGVASALTAAVLTIERRVVDPLRSDVQAIATYRPPCLVEVVDRDGNPFDALGTERREWVDLQEVPPLVADAFVAAEDRRFWRHPGVDATGIGRAAWANLWAGGVEQGGSTITQQVVKQLLVGDDPTLSRKAKEAVAAVLLEGRRSKQEILELYLNLVHLGHGNYGIGAASDELFGRSVDELGPEHGALLASLVPAPSSSWPPDDPESARVRRDRVLEGMADAGFLSEDEAAALQEAPLGLVAPSQGPPTTADAYRTEVRRVVDGLFGGQVPTDLGLRIHTAFDPAVQASAERAVRHAVDRVDRRARDREDQRRRKPAEDPCCQGAAVVLDTRSGEVLALVGGFHDPLGGLVRATQSRRQPGSAFKPFVYAAALEAGASGRDLVLDEPLALPDGEGEWWSPENHSAEYQGLIPLRSALATSSNTAAVRTAEVVGVDAVIDVAHRLGIGSPLRDDLTLALGSSEVTVLELTTAYAAIADEGRRKQPVLVTRITDRDGNTLVVAGDSARIGGRTVRLPGAPHGQAMEPAVARQLRSMLEGVVDVGTAWKAYDRRQERAGKTGTSSRNTDAWFVGFTPTHTVGVWIGRDDNQPLGPRETGARAALPAWLEVVEALGVPGPGDPPDRFDAEPGLAASAGEP